MTLDSRVTRLAAALVAGLLLALAFPGVGFGPLGLVALAPLIAATLRASSAKEAFALGWSGYFVTWMVNVPWVIQVMVTHGGLPMPVGVALYTAMSATLAVYGGIFTLLVRRFRAAPPAFFWFLVPAAWAALEYVRTYALTGFPWHLLASALVDETRLVIMARVLGPYGISFLAVVPAAVFGWILATPRMVATKRAGLAVTASLLAGWMIAGSLVLARVDPAAGTPFRAAMLQPDISQEMRWDAGNTMALFDRMMAMTSEAAAGGAQVVIWPESTVPLTFLRYDFFRDAVRSASVATGADIILGSVAEDEADPSKIWNAAYLVSGGEVSGRYDKIRLVPFGEYVPLRRLLFFAEKLVRAVGTFQFGMNDRPLEGRHRYGPAICYEVVYPQIGATQVRHGADVLVTITNDGWFDRTSAPRQHLDQARLRAIETDRWLLRAATTGISALVDPAGRVVDELEVGERGIVAGTPTARQSITAYVRFGDWLAIVLTIVVALAALRPSLLTKGK